MPDSLPSLPSLSAVEATVRLYLDGLHEGAAEKIARAFHPCAHLYSAREGQVADLPRADWLAMIGKRPSPAAQGAAREDRILAVDFADDTLACVKVECAVPPRRFTDYLLLLNTAEGWRIVAKGFTTRPPAG